jgi:hypothetical protein
MCDLALTHGLTSIEEFGAWRAFNKSDSERNTASNLSKSRAMVSLEPTAISFANTLPLKDSSALFVVALPGAVNDLAHPRLKHSKYSLHRENRKMPDRLGPEEFLRIDFRPEYSRPRIAGRKANG